MNRSAFRWRPKVFHYGDSHWRDYRSYPSKSTTGDSLTLFVDNLPNKAETPWLRKLYASFGLITKAFIPNKRSSISGNKFGFISFNSSDSVFQAIAHTSGLRVGNKNLFVRKAKFSRRLPSEGSLLGVENLKNKRLESHYPTGTNEPPVMEVEKSICFQPLASEWLWRSAIAELKDVSTSDIISNAFSMKNFKEIRVRPMGGKFMLITFHNKEDRLRALSNEEIKGWFSSFKQWNGDAASLSRIVWLKIRGMPLNAWGQSSFKKIAEFWGEFLILDKESSMEEAFDIGRLLMVTHCNHKINEWINISVKGRNYRAQVWEEECNDPFEVNVTSLKEQQWSNNNPIHCPLNENAIPAISSSIAKPCSPEKRFDNDVEEIEDSVDNDMEAKRNSVIGLEMHGNQVFNELGHDDRAREEQEEEISSCMPNQNEVASVNPPAYLQLSMPLHCIETNNVKANLQCNVNTSEASAVGSEKTIDEEMVLDSFNGCAEDVIEEFQSNEGQDKRHEDQRAENIIQATIKGVKGKKKRKSIEEILGFTKTQKKGKGKGKCAVMRSAVAAAALSVSLSSQGINNRNRIILDEAQAIWELNKLNNIGYDGDEDEVISKLVEMETLRTSRADCNH